MNEQTQTQYDPQAVAMVRAIKMQESGNDYNAPKESAGVSLGGAYQYQAPTWKAYAGEVLGDPNAPFTPENQDKVTYGMVKKWKDNGMQPPEIAHMWNPGDPKYPDQVVNHLRAIAQAGGAIPGKGNSQGYNPKPYSHPTNVNPGAVDYSGMTQPTDTTATPQDTSLGGQLAGRVNQASQAISDTTSGKQNILSGILQTVGAGAGALGDVVNKGLEMIPGVKQVENMIGQGVGSLAQTPGGQSVVKAINDFSQTHPELSKDIGAGFNIVTAIPIFRGLGAIKNVAMDAASSALQGVAERSATEGLTKVVSSTIAGRNALAKTPDVIKTLVSERALPDIEGGKYVTKEAAHQLSDTITSIDEKELQPILEQISQKQNFGQSLTTLKRQAIQEVENDTTLKEAGSVPDAIKQIEKRFAGWQHSYGDTIDLATQNRLKIGTGKFTNWGTPEGSADKAMYRAFQKNIEDVAQKNGMADVSEINQRMAALIRAQGVLRHIEGKAVKTGMLGEAVRTGATVAGEAAGNATGIPFAGAFGGYKAGGYVGKKLTGIPESILRRTGKGATRQGVGTTIKKTGGLMKGAFAQKAAGS